MDQRLSYFAQGMEFGIIWLTRWNGNVGLGPAFVLDIGAFYGL